MVSHLVKRLVINDVYRVNEDLQKITSGNLDVQLNERTTPEFEMLSDGINKTVQSLKQAISTAAGRIDAELEFARAIQCSSLPSVFPAYPEREDFDIFAVMRAAKVVGGDFYDFYLRDKNQLVIVVADVADKGIGAALFMMTAKTLIKSLAESGLSPAEIFTQANRRISTHNDQDIFLTAFLGYKINFFLIQLSNINIVTTAQKFDADHIFINSAVIHISAAQDCITNPRITQIEFLGAFQILLATNIISLNIIENKSVAQIFDIFAHRYVTCRYIIRIQKLTDLVRRSQIADIVHQELAQSLQNGCIR